MTLCAKPGQGVRLDFLDIQLKVLGPNAIQDHDVTIIYGRTMIKRVARKDRSWNDFFILSHLAKVEMSQLIPGRSTQSKPNPISNVLKIGFRIPGTP